MANSSNSSSGKDETKDIITKLDIITINFTSFITVMQGAIEIGSKRHKLSKKDLHVISPADELTTTPDLWKLVSHGTRFFDAMAYLSCVDKTGISVTEPNETTKQNIISIEDVCNAIYYWYFILMTRGNWPGPDEVLDTIRGGVPAFLKKTMAVKGTSKDMEIKIASFEVQKLPTDWIRYIEIPKLAPETKQRLALSFPGYRMFQPFKLLDPTKQLDPVTANAVKIVQDFLRRGYFWDIHSATRNPVLIQDHVSINNVLGNLIVAAYTPEEIKEMVKQRMLFQEPTKKYGCDTWRTWKPNIFDKYTAIIKL